MNWVLRARSDLLDYRDCQAHREALALLETSVQWVLSEHRDLMDRWVTQDILVQQVLVVLLVRLVQKGWSVIKDLLDKLDYKASLASLEQLARRVILDHQVQQDHKDHRDHKDL